MIVVIADSTTTSAMPAGSSRPIGCLRSMRISMCRPWFFRRTAEGASSVAAIAGELARVAQGRSSPSPSATTSSRALDREAPSHPARLPPASGAASSSKLAGKAMTFCAAHRVVALAALRAAVVGDRVGAVERVVEAAPARIGGIQRIARVHHRHDQLRPGDLGDLRIDIGGRDCEGGAFRQEVADLAQEGLVGVEIEGLVAAAGMPGVDLGLQLVALREKFAIARREIVDDRVEAGPEIFRARRRSPAALRR